MLLARRLDEVYRIGGRLGANRVGGTPEEDEACDLVAGWMEEAGLAVERDGRGNVIGRLRGERPELPEVWTGSHLDSVPEGGKFDGPLGVLAGLDAVGGLSTASFPAPTSRSTSSRGRDSSTPVRRSGS